MSQDLPQEIEMDPRLKAIMWAAFDTFAQYGYRRTSMEDIATAAGVSRPALYLHFRNKEDIFRSLAQHYFDTACTGVATALATEGPLDEVLLRAFHAKDGEAIAHLLTSPHGAEFMDVKTTNSADITAEGDARLRAVFAEWLVIAEARGQVTLKVLGGTADEVADVIYAMLYGLKNPPPTLEIYRRRQERLAKILARALAP